MNKKGRRLYRPPSAWEIERKRLKELFERWLDYRLNKFFDLSIHGPGHRKYWILVLGAGFIAAAFMVHTILYFFPGLAPARPFQLSGLPLFFLLTITRLIIILFIPAYIAITMAGNYLADIFELKDKRVAWDFISELSLGGANQVVHIRDGKVSEESLNSPILLIGGPGLVLVEFDSAALFEKPDGTPHVVGPAKTKPEDIILEGFERLRGPIINLRDQYIGSPSAEPMTIFGRSLDGIRVSATDVRAVFSVRRAKDEDSQVPTTQLPYPVHTRDIENLIYKQAVPVLTEGAHPSGEPGHWAGIMQGLVRGSLSEFMNQNNLAEYLASIGALEVELSEFREDTILLKTLQYSNGLPDHTPNNISRPKFHPRTELSDRFKKYTEGFSKRAQEYGLELHWIGVGTWKMPNEISSEIVNEQHLEAWRMNLENVQRSAPDAMQAIADEAYFNEKARLIQSVPLAAHQKNRLKYSDKDVLAECLLQDYWEQLGDALGVHYKNGTRSPELETIEKGTLKIEKLLKIPHGHHVIGGGSMSKVRPRPSMPMDQEAPPAPSSRSEAEHYQTLLSKLEGNYKVVEGMIVHEAKRYPALNREELIEQIAKRFERYSRRR